MVKGKLPSLNFVDIFCGAGGLSCGLEMAGHRCLLGVDQDKYAMETFAKNHHEASSYCGDIRALSLSKIKELTKGKEIHAVVGGPPCQGFSTVGTGNPKDSRNSLFLQFVRIVKLTKPQFIVIENVTGLLAKKNENTLKSIFECFKKLGFHLDVQVMQAQNYGVAEHRRRTIIIGSRKDQEILFPLPTHDCFRANKFRPAVCVSDVLYDLEAKKNLVYNHDKKSAALKNELELKRLKCIPAGAGIRYQKDEEKYLPKPLRLGIDWKNLKENRFRQTKYFRLDPKKPSPTIMTHRHSYYHPKEHRYLTAREAARLQSFPNNFEFCGPVSAQWRQIGNAVPPLLGKSLGIALAEMCLMAPPKNTSRRDHKALIQKRILENRGKAFVYNQKS
jgi:DNA (cytosine-5)-methyltransferase 1